MNPPCITQSCRIKQRPIDVLDLTQVLWITYSHVLCSIGKDWPCPNCWSQCFGQVRRLDLLILSYTDIDSVYDTRCDILAGADGGMIRFLFAIRSRPLIEDEKICALLQCVCLCLASIPDRDRLERAVGKNAARWPHRSALLNAIPASKPHKKTVHPENPVDPLCVSDLTGLHQTTRHTNLFSGFSFETR